MNDEWMELTMYDMKRLCIRRDNIARIIESNQTEDPFYVGCHMSTIGDLYYALAGEYDIVRDEITGGKWSRKRWLANHWTEACAKTLQAYQPIKPYLAPSDMEPK